jgi:hypothetical protein
MRRRMNKKKITMMKEIGLMKEKMARIRMMINLMDKN